MSASETLPDVQTLARARLDSVLPLDRARLLRPRAQPGNAAEIVSSTETSAILKRSQACPASAAPPPAILAFAFQQRHPILDGNVKRVTRLHDRHVGLAARHEKTPGRSPNTTRPRRASPLHPAIMDLGATLCHTQPDCPACPLQQDCRPCTGSQKDFGAHGAQDTGGAQGRDADDPRCLRPRILAQRPPVGVGRAVGFRNAHRMPAERLLLRCVRPADQTESPWPVRRHGFSHFQLHITPIPHA